MKLGFVKLQISNEVFHFAIYLRCSATCVYMCELCMSLLFKIMPKQLYKTVILVENIQQNKLQILMTFSCFYSLHVHIYFKLSYIFNILVMIPLFICQNFYSQYHFPKTCFISGNVLPKINCAVNCMCIFIFRSLFRSVNHQNPTVNIMHLKSQCVPVI